MTIYICDYWKFSYLSKFCGNWFLSKPQIHSKSTRLAQMDPKHIFIHHSVPKVARSHNGRPLDRSSKVAALEKLSEEQDKERVKFGVNTGERVKVGKIVDEDEISLSQEFPDSFKPRQAVSMPMKEKVSTWMSSVPYHLDEFDQVLIDCYSGVIEYDSTDTQSSCGPIDLSEVDAIMELQARKVTRYATRVYINELEPVVRVEEDVDSYIDSDGNPIELPDDMLHYENALKYFGPKFLQKNPQMFLETS